MLDNIKDCEKIFTEHLENRKGKIFIGQIFELSQNEVIKISDLIKEYLSGQFNNTINNLINKYPNTIIFYMVWFGRYYYYNNYWFPFFQHIGIQDHIQYQDTFGTLFLKKLKENKLKEIEKTNINIYVSNILLHCGIPLSCYNDEIYKFFNRPPKKVENDVKTKREKELEYLQLSNEIQSIKSPDENVSEEINIILEEINKLNSKFKEKFKEKFKIPLKREEIKHKKNEIENFIENNKKNEKEIKELLELKEKCKSFKKIYREFNKKKNIYQKCIRETNKELVSSKKQLKQINNDDSYKSNKIIFDYVESIHDVNYLSNIYENLFKEIKSFKKQIKDFNNQFKSEFNFRIINYDDISNISYNELKEIIISLLKKENEYNYYIENKEHFNNKLELINQLETKLDDYNNFKKNKKKLYKKKLELENLKNKLLPSDNNWNAEARNFVLYGEDWTLDSWNQYKIIYIKEKNKNSCRQRLTKPELYFDINNNVIKLKFKGQRLKLDDISSLKIKVIYNDTANEISLKLYLNNEKKYYYTRDIDIFDSHEIVDKIRVLLFYNDAEFLKEWTVKNNNYPFAMIFNRDGKFIEDNIIPRKFWIKISNEYSFNNGVNPIISLENNIYKFNLNNEINEFYLYNENNMVYTLIVQYQQDEVYLSDNNNNNVFIINSKEPDKKITIYSKNNIILNIPNNNNYYNNCIFR